jgi:Right handed beta helix region
VTTIPADVRGAVRGLPVLAVCAAGALGFAQGSGAALRDDTASIQARLDAGGNVFLPKLADGRCYRTRGLWVSRDGTSITSDGACIVALGPGEARIKTGSGQPVKATGVFFLTHSNVRAPTPVRVTINGLHIRVPAAVRMHGVAVFGHATTLSNLTIDGAPLANVLMGSGKPGAGGLSSRNAVRDSTLSGGTRDVVAAYGAVGLRVERNKLVASRNGAGLHIRAADRGQPTLDVRVAGNTMVGNAGPGVFLDLVPKNGAPVLASDIEVTGNRVTGNGRAGLVLAGGQYDGQGTLTLRDNVVRGNRGPGILEQRLRLVVTAERNDLRGNRGRPVAGTRARPAAGKPQAVTMTPPATSSPRDDTRWLQARLDRSGGTIFLPKLPNGECYATRGLWVSHDDTTITSDGACIVSLGLGPVRLRSNDGDPIASSGVFFVNRSRPTKPAPVRVTISNLRIVVPEGQGMFGIVVYGHQVELRNLDIGGAPKDAITIAGRANGNDYAARISILDSKLSGAGRNAISATGVIGLRIEGNTIEGVRDAPPGQPAAGIDVEPDSRGAPILGVRIARNTIRDNAGPGILLELEPNDGPAVVATALEISANTIVGNSAKRTPPKRAGVVLAGGQDVEHGTLALDNNVIRGNGGPGILGSRLRLVVRASGNDLGGNEGGPSRGL